MDTLALKSQADEAKAKPARSNATFEVVRTRVETSPEADTPPQLPPPSPRLLRFSGRSVARLTLLISDLIVLSLAGLLAADLAQGTTLLAGYLALLPLFIAALVSMSLLDLYPGFGISPPEQLKRSTLAILATGLVSQATVFIAANRPYLSRDGLLAYLGLSVVGVPLARALVRHLFCRRPWWSQEVVVLGAGKTGANIVRVLRRNPGLGFRPVAVFDDNPELWNKECSGLQVCGGLETGRIFAKSRNIDYAMLAMPGVSPDRLTDVIEEHSESFKHILVIPNLFGVGLLWSAAKEMNGVLGLEVFQKLLSRRAKMFKAVVDYAGGLLALVLSLPILFATAVAIKLESPGPILFRQARLGRDGRIIQLLKFRSMFIDAEQRLADLLSSDPALHEEYSKFHKLRNDPRVTKVGKLIRKLSVDELPQLLNVLRGEVSMVGPRAYMVTEQGKMLGKENSILRVTPGITGLWQVSGRNENTFEERIGLDLYYVRNWSPWMDVYLLTRTIWVVVFQRGAY